MTTTIKALFIMDTTDRAHLRELLTDEEGFVPHAYQDSLGFWTIGIGRLIDQRKGGGITREEADYLLGHDIDTAVRGLFAALPWFPALNPVRQAILVAMAFQMGVDGVLEFHHTLQAAERGDAQAVKRGMLHSKWGTEDSPARAKRMADLWVKGEWDV